MTKNAIAYALTEEMCNFRRLVVDGRWGQGRMLMWSRWWKCRLV